MSPRAYRMQAREAAAERTRARIVAAARRLLSARGGIGAFTIDAVAGRAGVARTTVYDQFGAKIALIEAVFDSLEIVRTGVPRLVGALALPDPLETLQAFVATFAEVWQPDRLVIRRLQGLAAVDREFARVWRRREERRREGLRIIVQRIGASDQARQQTAPFDADLVTDVLFAIVAFETYDVIAGPRRMEDVAPAIGQLARDALGIARAPDPS